MREKIAIAVCALAFVIVVVLSYLFAVRHNPESVVGSQGLVEGQGRSGPPDAVELNGETTTSDSSPVINSRDFERGRDLFGQHACATCHSILGNGNPRHPLDGTGNRWTPDELQHWMLGTGDAADELSAAIRRRKQRYQSLPLEDLNALVRYLSSLRE